MENIKQVLQTKEYDFLYTHPQVKNKIMLLVPGGSHAYGTNIESSDIDIRGILHEDPKTLIGLSNFEQFEDSQTDTTLYGFKKMINLLLNCNPNTIEILGTEPEQIIMISNEGKLLRDNADLFLSQKAANSFGGYANTQLRRLQNALARDSYPQSEKEKHILGSIMSQIEHLKKHYAEFDDSQINLYVGPSNKEDLESEIFIDINLKHYPLRDFMGIHSEMSNVVRDYDKLNKRNKKKDEPHLLKHGMHLIRLLIMGSEILVGKGINTYRKKDRELLLDIRNGVYSYEELFELVDKVDKEFQYAKKNTVLPPKPNFDKVQDLVMEINLNTLKKYDLLKV